jgi:hypothetical protein
MKGVDLRGLQEILETPSPKSMAAAIPALRALKKKFARKLVAGTVAATVLMPLLLVLAPQQAQALPAFARQTGQNCVSCHAGGQFPELTPYGRLFKMTGYTIGERKVPLSVMAVVSAASVRNTTKSDDPTVDFAKNGAVTFSSASLFIAGKVTENIGMFSQITYDNYAGQDGFTGHSNADNIDVRYADRFIDSNRDLIFGVSVNNNPSISDPWNTAPAWMQYVPVASPTSNQFVDGNAPYPGYASGGNIAGLTVYAYLNKMLYGEVGGYRTANRALSIMSAGIPNAGTTKLKGTNPYWRLALTHEWGPHNIMVGASGMKADIFDNPEDTSDPASTHRFKDQGVDAQYQYLLDPHTVTAQLAYMRNRFPNSVDGSNTNNTLRAKLTYTYQAKYGGSLGYFDLTGSTDTGTIDPTRVTGNVSGDPATRGFTYEAFWTPVQYVRVGLQYTTYSKFHGATSNYDGSGRDAKDNNTLLFYIWGAY